MYAENEKRAPHFSQAIVCKNYSDEQFIVLGAQPLRQSIEYHQSPLGGLPISELQRQITGWINACRRARRSQRTIDGYEDTVKLFLWFLKAFGYETCNQETVEAYFDYLIQPPASGRWIDPLTKESVAGDWYSAARAQKELSVGTIHTYYVKLRAYFNWLVKRKILDESPLCGFMAPPPNRDQVAPFTLDQVQQIIATAAKNSRSPDRDVALLWLMYDTGIRASEICCLQVRHLNWEQQSLRVYGKGDKERTVYFSDTAAGALWEYLSREEAKGLKDQDHLFRSIGGRRMGTQMTRGGIYDIFKRISEKVRFNGVRMSPHTMRHAFSVAFLRNGGKEKTLQHRLGHTSRFMTDRYVKFAEADMQEEARRCSPADHAASAPKARNRIIPARKP